MNPEETIQPGDVVFLVFVEDQIKCTKRKPSSSDAIFGRSVVAGAAGLEPYTVADPYGASVQAGVRVVYLGHAFVRVNDDVSEAKVGSTLCAGVGDGCAVISNDRSGPVLGKVIGKPVVQALDCLVPAFIFVGRGEHEEQLADLTGHLQSFKVRMGEMEVVLDHVKDGHLWIQEALRQSHAEMASDVEDLQKGVSALRLGQEECKERQSVVESRMMTVSDRLAKVEAQPAGQSSVSFDSLQIGETGKFSGKSMFVNAKRGEPLPQKSGNTTVTLTVGKAEIHGRFAAEDYVEFTE